MILLLICLAPLPPHLREDAVKPGAYALVVAGKPGEEWLHLHKDGRYTVVLGPQGRWSFRNGVLTLRCTFGPVREIPLKFNPTTKEWEGVDSSGSYPRPYTLKTMRWAD